MVMFSFEHGQSRVEVSHGGRPLVMKFRALTPKKLVQIAGPDPEWKGYSMAVTKEGLL